MNIEDKKMYLDKWFSYLQAQICKQFEKIEKESKGLQKFVSTNWQKNIKGGGGTYKILNRARFDTAYLEEVFFNTLSYFL